MMKTYKFPQAKKIIFGNVHQEMIATLSNHSIGAIITDTMRAHSNTRGHEYRTEHLFHDKDIKHITNKILADYHCK